MRKFRSLSLLLLAISLISASCTKEGPEGPVGAAGAQGPAGPVGPAGPTGPAGGATYSAWFTPGAAWTTTGIAPYAASYIYTKAAPGVTQDVIDKGVVLAYAKGLPIETGATLTPTTYVSQLPFIEPFYADVYDFALTPGNVVFTYKAGQAPWLLTVLATIQFRYVIIAGTLLGGRSTTPTYNGYTEAQVRAMSYEEVISKFQIAEQGEFEIK